MTSQSAGKTALILAVAIVTLGVAFGAAAKTSLPHGDAKFVQKALAHGTAEVELAQLAREKAMREEVKQFAERMIADHQKANDELQALAMSGGVEARTGPDRKHARGMEKLKRLSGGEFDRAYMRMMVKDHKEAVEDFRHAAKRKKANDVSQFAARTLPTLEDHLRLAQSTTDITAASKRAGDRETGSTKK